MWDWRSGQCTGEVEIWGAVEPFVAVRKREKGETQKRKGKGKKSKRRRIAVSKDTDEDEVGEKVLVVSKIESVERGEKKFVVFSAVG